MLWKGTVGDMGSACIERIRYELGCTLSMLFIFINAVASSNGMSGLRRNPLRSEFCISIGIWIMELIIRETFKEAILVPRCGVAMNITLPMNFCGLKKNISVARSPEPRGDRELSLIHI